LVKTGYLSQQEALIQFFLGP